MADSRKMFGPKYFTEDDEVSLREGAQFASALNKLLETPTAGGLRGELKEECLRALHRFIVKCGRGTKAISADTYDDGLRQRGPNYGPRRELSTGHVAPLYAAMRGEYFFP